MCIIACSSRHPGTGRQQAVVPCCVRICLHFYIYMRQGSMPSAIIPQPIYYSNDEKCTVQGILGIEKAFVQRHIPYIWLAREAVWRCDIRSSVCRGFPLGKVKSSLHPTPYSQVHMTRVPYPHIPYVKTMPTPCQTA